MASPNFDGSRAWLQQNIGLGLCVDPDYGLAEIASYFGKSEALNFYWQGSEKENSGDVAGAISLYRRAFKLWPALDSIVDGGIPRGVRLEAESCSANFKLLSSIDVSAARSTDVVFSHNLLNDCDINDIETLRKLIIQGESIFVNNPQNHNHSHKTCIFLNNPPSFPVLDAAPHVIEKLLRFAQEAWNNNDWSGGDGSGVLGSVTGHMASLFIRVVEHWSYSVGGSLPDPFHYDVDSVITIVAMLSDHTEFEGGVFRTHEPDGHHKEHPMGRGDAVCFISHKYHNVTEIIRGTRQVLVIELWQGGMVHSGR
jgi:hypothetical protein